ncbi:MAG: signal peptidase I, partial [Gemmatimonadota bacterium]|nr:signal peptidase I [Gemmatimonadota bacterium]
MAGHKNRGKRGRGSASGSPPNRHWENGKTIFWALLIALFIRSFFFQAFRIPSGSMEDTLLVGDFLLVDKLTYGAKIPFTEIRLPGFRDPKRGDIIVFKAPVSNKDYIKRCVAVAGETLELRDDVLHIEDEPLHEPYIALKPSLHSDPNFGPVTVPNDAIFMMGDNRHNSADSRYFGFLDKNRVVGRAFVLYWSWSASDPPALIGGIRNKVLRTVLSLPFGKPRITRIGDWIATDYSEIYHSTGVSPADEVAEVASPADEASAGVSPAD